MKSSFRWIASSIHDASASRYLSNRKKNRLENQHWLDAPVGVHIASRQAAFVIRGRFFSCCATFYSNEGRAVEKSPQYFVAHVVEPARDRAADGYVRANHRQGSPRRTRLCTNQVRPDDSFAFGGRNVNVNALGGAFIFAASFRTQHNERTTTKMNLWCIVETSIGLRLGFGRIPRENGSVPVFANGWSMQCPSAGTVFPPAEE